MTLPELFKLYLRNQDISPVSVRNYLADLNHFFNWLAQNTGIKHQVAGKSIFGLFTTKTLEEYKKNQTLKNTPPSTINRRLSSLRKFGYFAKAQGLITENVAEKVENLSPREKKGLGQTVLEEFAKYLKKTNVNPITRKNYLCDLRHFIGWLQTSSQ